jgi:cytochrome c oxidase subunit 3
MKYMSEQKHSYHLVDPSPWPIVTAFSAFNMLVGAVLYIHSYKGGLFILFFGLLLTVLGATVWWRDVVREGTFEGHHTLIVQKGLAYGMLLFIVSEVCFFVAFFWAFFHSSLVPTLEIGNLWPPMGIEVFNPWGVPLLNTIILLTSGASITWAHHSILAGDMRGALKGLVETIVLAVLFTALQAYEYKEATFSISDGIYGSTFFMATGFHGFHVIIGTIFIVVCLFRLKAYHLTRQHHFGFEAAAWYWHFVDVVWLFLFTTIYWWGSL